MNQDGLEDVNIFQYIELITRYWKMIVAVTAGACVLSVVISLILPNYYAGKASVMPSSQDLASLKTSMLTSADSLLGLKSQSDVWVGILKSNSVRDRIIERFNLKVTYGQDTREGARKALDNLVSISKSKDDIVTIVVEDKVPETAAAMANAFVEELDNVNKKVTMTSGKATRLFVERRLDEAKAELAAAEERIREFSDKNKSFLLEEQYRGLIESVGKINLQIMALEGELDALRTYATEENPKVQILVAKVKGLHQQAELAHSGEGDFDSDIIIPTSVYPDLALQYTRLMRDAKVQEVLFETLVQEYELARIQEARDSPTLQILDRSTVPEKRSRPSRTFIVAISTILGAVLSCFTAFMIEYARKARINTAEKYFAHHA